MRIPTFAGFAFLVASSAYAQFGYAPIVGSVEGTAPVALEFNFTIYEIKDVPFCADVIETREYFLRNGTAIHIELHGKVFRDSAGRIRTEREVAGGRAGVHRVQITIMDPVLKTKTSFDMETNSATVDELVQPLAGVPKTPYKFAKKHSPDTPPVNGSEDMGTTNIAGYDAQGCRATHLLPAGQYDSDKQLIEVAEKWFFLVLETHMLSRRESPWEGKYVTTMTKVQRGEPDPKLFQPPPNYKVNDRRPSRQ
jgi:hypothetical protein